MNRSEMRAAGFRACAKSSDLFAFGYMIITWFSPSRAVKDEQPCVLVEYLPRKALNDPRVRHPIDLGRMTATTLDEQIAIHRRLGAPVNHQLDLLGSTR